MELNRYQEESLDRFGRWLGVLKEKKHNAEELASVLKKSGMEVPNISSYPAEAWKAMAKVEDVADAYHVDRFYCDMIPIPHVCFKIPTGGGKTLMASAALERLNRKTGLILWVVPTKKIYEQAKDALRRRTSPIRSRLDRASGGMVKFFEKGDNLNVHDVNQYLCVMLLSLSAVNRNRNKDFLLFNRDDGKYQTFFPDADDAKGKADALERYPGLEQGPKGAIKRSLANVFRMVRPVIILDEAHKAYEKNGQEYASAINRLGPSMVIEMSATPNPGISNLLVDVSGMDLWKEEMIKMPIYLHTQSDKDWKHLLDRVHADLGKLDDESQLLQSRTGRYIRPIALVRVERTGKNQRNTKYIHAEDAREHLMNKLAVPASHIAIQSTENDDLKGINLMSETSDIRWIITKDAIKEGWDCPFAYSLAILDNITAKTTVTQLIGRVLRQPGASLTDADSLNKCYVYCNNPDTAIVTKYVKAGLRAAGLDDMAERMVHASQDEKVQMVRKRSRFPKQVFLPMVLHKSGNGWAKLDYGRHILSKVKFDKLEPPDIPEFNPEQQGWTIKAIGPDGELPGRYKLESHVKKVAGLSDFALSLSYSVVNVWQAARIAQKFIQKLRDARKTDSEIYNGLPYLLNVLRNHIDIEIDKMAEKVFRDKVKKREIRFDLEMSDRNYKVKTYDAEHGKILLRDDGHPVQLSLFGPVYEEEFDTNLERGFAKYLDMKETVKWWHRVAASQSDGYYLSGWRKHNIRPDFVAMTNEAGDKVRLGIYDTKGKHLVGNLDTEYKKDVFEVLEGAFNCGTVKIRGNRIRGEFKLVVDGKFEEVLA